jgi:hypothetical protein
VESFGVVSSAAEQRGGGVGSHPVAVEELWGMGGERLGDPELEVSDLVGKVKDPAG